MKTLQLISPDVSDFKQDLLKFHKLSPIALSRAMNRSAKVAQTAALRRVRDQWNIKAKDIKKKTKIQRATVTNPVYVFSFKSSPINLIEFGARQLKKGVSYKIQKERKKLGERSFINKSRGHKYVFVRESKERYPIMPYFSITPSTMFEMSKAQDVFIDTFYNGKGGVGGFKARYLHEMSYLWSR